MLAAEPRLRAIRNKQNCGKPVSMNRAMGHARGRWLAVLDADDWYIWSALHGSSRWRKRRARR